MAPVIRRSRLRDERGAELIELAIALPLLLLVLMGIVDFGFMFQRYLVLTNAAMEGARVAVLPGYTAADAQARATAYATAGGVPVGEVTVTAQPWSIPGGPTGTWPGVRVRVQHQYRYPYIGPIVGLVGGGSFSSVTLTAQSIVRAQLGS